MAATGQIGILNVGAGDTKLTFDKNNPAERIRAARIVTDMLRRGYALLVEVDRNGVKAFQRVTEFDEEKCEYIIADFDSSVAAKADTEEDSHEEAEEAAKEIRKPSGRSRSAGKAKTRAIPAESTRAVAVPRTAGG